MGEDLSTAHPFISLAVEAGMDHFPKSTAWWQRWACCVQRSACCLLGLHQWGCDWDPPSFNFQLGADRLLFPWKPCGNLCTHPESDPVSWCLFPTPLGIAQGCWPCTTDTTVPALLGACRYWAKYSAASKLTDSLYHRVFNIQSKPKKET